MSLPLLYRWKNDPANSSSIPPILVCSSTSTVCSPLGGEKLKLGATLLFRSAPRGFRNLMTLATLWVPQWQYHCWKSQPASSLLPAERRQVCVQRRGDVKLSSWKLNNVPRIMYPWVNLHSLCAEKETLHPSVCHLAKFCNWDLLLHTFDLFWTMTKKKMQSLLQHHPLSLCVGLCFADQCLYQTVFKQIRLINNTACDYSPDCK